MKIRITNKLQLVFVSAFLALTTVACSKKENKKPNIIIIMADDLGYGDISCYGNSYINTPNLDKMAAEGIKFTDFHSNGSVCSPTRAALLTGKYQQRVGIDGVVTAKYHRDHGLAVSEKTFAESMKEEGYVTGMFGKWHIGYKKEFNPIHQGFDEYIGYVAGNVDYHSHIDQEGYEDWWNGDTKKNEKGYSTDLITDHAVDFIQRHKEEPFMLYIPHEAPHGPFQGRTSKAERYIGWKNDPNHKLNMSKEELNAVYKEMIEVMDEGIGKVMATLKELDLDENTFVFFCSDNGGTSKVGNNGPLKGFKANLAEGGHRVPAIAWYPNKIKGNQINSETILTMDLYPTMVEMAGGAVPENIDGISVKENLFNGTPLPKRDTYWAYVGRKAMRDGDWKLMLPKKNAAPQLYNLKEDIGEQNNVASQYPERVNKMMEKVTAWYKEVTPKK